LEPELYLF